MNRRAFLRFLGAGAAAVALAPLVRVAPVPVRPRLSDRSLEVTLLRTIREDKHFALFNSLGRSS